VTPLLNIFGKKSPVLGQNLMVFGDNRGLKLNMFITPKRHIFV